MKSIRRTLLLTVLCVLLVTLALNLTVVAAKLTAGLLAGSLSVISDAIHSSVDSLNNVVGLVIMKYATAEPDEGHPYGHAKFETLAAFAIAGFLFVTCYQISLSAIERVITHDAPAPEITDQACGKASIWHSAFVSEPSGVPSSK